MDRWIYHEQPQIFVTGNIGNLALALLFVQSVAGGRLLPVGADGRSRRRRRRPKAILCVFHRVR